MTEQQAGHVGVALEAGEVQGAAAHHQQDIHHMRRPKECVFSPDAPAPHHGREVVRWWCSVCGSLAHKKGLLRGATTAAVLT